LALPGEVPTVAAIEAGASASGGLFLCVEDVVLSGQALAK
jgi:hypothetical protein